MKGLGDVEAEAVAAVSVDDHRPGRRMDIVDVAAVVVDSRPDLGSPELRDTAAGSLETEDSLGHRLAGSLGRLAAEIVDIGVDRQVDAVVGCSRTGRDSWVGSATVVGMAGSERKAERRLVGQHRLPVDVTVDKAAAAVQDKAASGRSRGIAGRNLNVIIPPYF